MVKPESGFVRKLEIPDPHLYFQASGGQCLRLVGIDEDLSFYEGYGKGPDVVKVKEAIRKEVMSVGINHQVGIKASPEEIYKYLTETEKLAQRWTTDTKGSVKRWGTFLNLVL